MTGLEFFVAGVPQPQGSKTGYAVGKRAVLVDSNKAVLKPWRSAVAEAAHRAWSEDEQRFDGALEVEVVFQFVRPKSVRREHPSVKPDVDKLARALLDGLTGSGMFRDDAQVVRLVAEKAYADRPGARVRVGRLVGGEREEAR